MQNRTHILITLLACVSFGLLSAGIMATANATQNTTPDKPELAQNKIYGKVTDIIDSAGYTYAEVDTGKTKVWAATTTTTLKKGDMISFSTSMPMKNYQSKTLQRSFPVVYFVEKFNTDSESAESEAPVKASPHELITSHKTGRSIKDFGKVEGGNTIAELYADKDRLSGQSIRVRGQVTKVTNNVMGKNWLHIIDGSTHDDLTITSSNTASIDDIIVIEGILSLDKDFSYGYVYPLIVEDVTIVKE